MLSKTILIIIKSISHSAVLATLIFSLLVTNFLTLTSSIVHNALYGLLDSIHVTRYFSDTPTQRTQKLKAEKKALVTKQQKRIHKIKGVTSRIAKRTARNVGVNVASVPAEALPWLGVASVVGVTAMDIKDGCDTMKDMNGLLQELDLETNDEETTVCGYTLPSTQELMDNLKDKVALSGETYRNFQDKLGGTIDAAKQNIEAQWQEFKDIVGITTYEMIH